MKFRLCSSKKNTDKKPPLSRREAYIEKGEFSLDVEGELTPEEFVKQLHAERRRRKELPKLNVDLPQLNNNLDEISRHYGRTVETYTTSLTYSPIQSILLNDTNNILREYSNSKKLLGQEELLHNLITGEDRRDMLDTPLIETALSNGDSSDVMSNLFSFQSGDEGCFITKDSINIKPAGSESNLKTLTDKCKDRVFGKNGLNGYQSISINIPDPTAGLETPITLHSPVTPLRITTPCTTENSEVYQSNAIGELMQFNMETRLDVIADFESFISNDKWEFTVGPAKKFKSLCSNSEHFWERNGKLPDI